VVLNNVNYITIPEGKVKYVSYNGLKVWERAHIYGVSWNKTNTATMTRTDDASGFSSPVIGVGTTNGSSPFDNCYPWNSIKVVMMDSNELVAIPKFWYKWTNTTNSLQLQIADKPVHGFKVSPMHADRGDGKGERDVCYIGRYKSVYDYRSRPSSAPVTSITIGTARSSIKNLGTGYYQQDYASFWTIRMLFLVEWATWDSQSVMQNTANYADNASIRTGNVTSMTYHTGISANGYSVQYRYIEDMYENTLEWLDGIYLNGSQLYCINNPNNLSSSSNGVNIGTISTDTGYIKTWSIPTVSGYEWALYPATVNSSVSYIQDGYYYTGTGTVAYIGGARNAWELHGLFFMYCDFTSSSTSSVIGTRIMKLP